MKAKTYSGGIFLCWGIESKVLIGNAFFNEQVCEKIIYDKPMIEKILSLNLFPASVTYAEVTRIKPVKELSRAYFDGHILTHSNGILQFSKTRPHSEIKQEDYPRFANALFRGNSKTEDLVTINKDDLPEKKKPGTNFRITIGYRAVISVDVLAPSKRAGEKKALESFKSAKARFFSGNIILEDDNFNAHGILNLDATWKMYDKTF